MNTVTRKALEEWDEDLRADTAELANLFEEPPPTLIFKGSNLHAEPTPPPPKVDPWWNEGEPIWFI